jgi:serine/threonine-protein kinase HipA
MAAVKNLEVHLYGDVLGYLIINDKTSEVFFELESNHWLVDVVSPLKVSRYLNPNKDNPLLFGPYFESIGNYEQGVPSLIADSLPDNYGNAVFKFWLEQKGIQQRELSVLDRLAYIGKRGLGALEYIPSSYNFNEEFDISLDQISMISEQIYNEVEIKEINSELLDLLFEVGTSAGGMQPKAIVSINRDSNQLIFTSKPIKGFIPSIIKFDGYNIKTGKPLEKGKVEFAYYLMLLDCGIDISTSYLIEHNDLSHFVTERFDINAKGEKLHLQSYSALVNANPRFKYSAGKIAKSMKNMQLSDKDLEKQFTRTLFNYMSGNDDFHLKNTSFVMNRKGEWSLSPAYDITNPYLGFTLKRNFPLTINKKSRGITKKDFNKLSKKYKVKNFDKIYNKVQVVLKGWSKYASKVNLSDKKTNEISKLMRVDISKNISI